MEHVIEIVVIEYFSPLNGAASHIVFSRAFFTDQFKPIKCKKISDGPSSFLEENSLHDDGGDLNSGQLNVPSMSTEALMASLGFPTSFGRQDRGPRRKSHKKRQGSSHRGSDGDFLTKLPDLAVIRDIVEPTTLVPLSRSLADLRFDRRDCSFDRQFSSDCFYPNLACKYSVICKTLALSVSLRQSHCHLPNSMSFYLPETWHTTDLLELKNNIIESLQSNAAFKQSEPAHLNENYIPSELRQCDLDGELKKYWQQRYRLFSLFDRGIHIDEEGLFSVTPEILAVHHARRLRRFTPNKTSPLVLDLFTGVGGNCIQLALAGFSVISVDINEEMLAMAKKNAVVYGVSEKISFVQADAFDYLRRSKERFDAILASPPWGGPQYSNGVFSLAKAKISGQLNIFDLVEALAQRIRSGGPVALFLPRNTNAVQLFDLQQCFVAADPLDLVPCLECELDVINQKPKAMTVYLHFGELEASTDPLPSNDTSPGISNPVQHEPSKTEKGVEEEDTAPEGQLMDSMWSAFQQCNTCTIS